jgi:hypothetical protein
MSCLSVERARRRDMPTYRIALIAVSSFLLTTISGLWIYSFSDKVVVGGSATGAVEIVAPPDSVEAPEPDPAIVLDVGGLRNPLFVPASLARLFDDEMIIGVIVAGEARAYLCRSFEHLPEKHLVHDKFGSLSVTVTHCDRTRYTRVFAARDDQEDLDIRCGGWLIEQEMALLVGGKKFPHSSGELPLTDLPFVVTTWKEWQQAQPKSVVYLGDIRPDSPKAL